MRQRIKPPRTPEYEAYLLSKEWAYVRQTLYLDRKGMCDRCGSDVGKYGWQAHHVHYRHLYNELNNMHTLMLVHRCCHEEIHADERLEKFYSIHFCPMRHRLHVWNERGGGEHEPDVYNLIGLPTIPVAQQFNHRLWGIVIPEPDLD